MAYRADIEIAVKGAQELKRLSDQISATTKLVDGLNNYLENIGEGGVVRNINNLQQVVNKAAATLNEAALETREATIAAKDYITATTNLNNGLKEKLQLLKQVNEAERQQRLTSAGVRETTQYGGPIGPGQASPVALASQLRGRTEQILQLEKVSIDASTTAFNAAVRHEKTLNELKEANSERLFNQKLQELNILAKRELTLTQQTDRQLLADFDKRLKARGEARAAGTAATGAVQGRLAGAFTGGAFPLLFGGGPGAVLGGFAGGLAGAGPAGLAASLTFSAIGQQFDRLTEQAALVGQALSSPINNFQVLKEKSLLSSKQQEQYVNVLIQSGEYAKAYSVIQKDLIANFGPDAVNKLETLDRVNEKYKRQIAELSVQLQALAAGPMIKFLGFVTKLLERFNTNFNLPPELQKRRENILQRARTPVMLGGATPAEVRKELEAIDKANQEYAQNPPEKKLKPWTEEYIQSQQKLRDLFTERYRLQLDKETALLQLSGSVSSEDRKRLELEKNRLDINNRLYAAKQQLKDIEAAGGTAKGIGGSQEVKNEINKLETQKIQLDIQVKEESLKKIEEDITRAAKAATHSIDMQVVAARGQQTIQQSQYDLMRSMNDLQLQRISFEEQLLNNAFEQTTNFSEQLAILDRLAELVQYRYELNVANANVERLSTIAQIKGTTDLLALEIQRQRIEYQSTVAFVAKQNAMGIYNQEQQKALTAQGNALDIAVSTYDYAVRNAVVQERIANAVYDQKVEAAGFARNMELASLASRRAGLNGGDNREAGMGLGQRFVMGRTYQGGSFEVSNSSLKKMAKGGYVTSPTMALIGEGGEPEFVVPQSKAMAFAENWMNGRRGADALPRLATVSSSPQPTINITTGPVMQQNGTTYVTLADMEQAMQTMASNMLGSNRSYSGRRYQGVS